MLELIIERLKGLGYEMTDGDRFTLNFILSKEIDYVKSECGGAVPDGLKYPIIDWIIAEFLINKKGSGALTKIGDIDLNEAPLKSLVEGDIRADWGGGNVKSAEERFDELVGSLTKGRTRLMGLYRVMIW